MDHLANGLNMWRHLLTFVGGQGMVVLVLTVLTKGASGAYKMYVGEGKDERLLPNVVHTARTIWIISLAYLGVGTLLLWIRGIALGMAADRSFLHGLWGIYVRVEHRRFRADVAKHSVLSRCGV